MNFSHLISLLSAQKKSFKLAKPERSFAIAAARAQPYIEPTFEKVLQFDTEQPAAVLISAVGATGKSTLAQVLSNKLKLPILDLAKHKAVGDNTLTGVLTSAFEMKDLSGVFEAISEGKFGVIVDGIDEGRSMVNDKSFDAFLDDIAKRCHAATNPSVILLGRTKALEDAYIGLCSRSVPTGLISIEPFDIASARKYIDEFTEGGKSKFHKEYEEVRDIILDRLESAFAKDKKNKKEERFLSFIGYPPVLDAIVTLLTNEPNYYRIKKELLEGDASKVDVRLLYRIAEYLLNRERSEKVIPILKPLLEKVPHKDEILAKVFMPVEQAMRITANRMNIPLKLSVIPDHVLNIKYEEQLATFVHEHPFIADNSFRNAVFEATSIALLIASEDEKAIELALAYVQSNRANYHLVYFLELLAQDGKLPLSCLDALISAAQEFKSPTSDVDLTLETPNVEYVLNPIVGKVPILAEIEIVIGENGESRVFQFRSTLDTKDSVRLGSKLSSATVSLPCEVELSGGEEIELTAPIAISATNIRLNSRNLVLKSNAQNSELGVALESNSVNSSIESLTSNNVKFTISTPSKGGLGYPLVQHVQTLSKLPQDPEVQDKFLRLRKILTLFRSHSKGALAKYKAKIEHERVAGNPIGSKVLERLRNDQIIRLEGNMYFLQPENFSKHLGVTWIELRNGVCTEKIVQYLGSIK